MTDTGPDKERRGTPRHDVSLPARLHVGDDVIDAQTIDLSHDSVLIGGEDFPSADEVYIEIELAELGWQRLPAEVVRRAEGDENHLAATFADAAASGGREAIRAFLAQHMGGR
jgi:hypothetical protein